MAMWNPWRGCSKYSEGCKYCCIHKGDTKRGIDTNNIVKTDHFNVELVVAGGESDKNTRPLDYQWLLSIREQCAAQNVSFEFRQCGTYFIKAGKTYTLNVRDLCSQAKKAGIAIKKQP